MNFGSRLKKIRKEKGLTQKKLAQLTGLSEISIRKYENNSRNPKLGVVLKLSEILDTPVSELCKEEFEGLSEKLKAQEKELNSSLYKLSQWDFNTLFSIIFTYMENTRNFKSNLDFLPFDETKEEDLKEIPNLISTTEIEEIINKVCDLVEFELYKIEKEKNNK